MSKEKKARHVLQPECKDCPRFQILKSPCSPDACIFRYSQHKPGWHKR